MAEETTLGFKVTGVESLDALTESVRDIQSAMGDLAKTKLTLGPGKKAAKQVEEVRKALQTVVKQYEQASRQSKAMGFGLVPGGKEAKAIANLSAKIRKEQEAIAAIERRVASEQIERGTQSWKAAKREIAQRQKVMRSHKIEAKYKSKALQSEAARHMESINEIEDFRKKRWNDHLGSVGKDAERAFKSIADADPFGLADSAGSFFKLMEQGSRSMAAKGGEKGGASGFMQEKTFKVLGKAAKALSKAAKTLGAMQSIWQVVQGALDAQAELNEMVLDTTGSMSLMGTTWGEFNKGAQGARKMMKDIRDQVTDWDANFDMGTTPKEQLAILQSFERQNFTIKEMAGIIRSGNSEYKKFTDFTWQAIRLQKALGLEAQETVEAIAFFTGDLGMSLGQVDKAFHQIAMNAIDANMNTKDFFATVMQVSSNMALYGVRVAETAVLLSKLGKALGPQQAKQALGGLVDMWKNMGDEQRLQMTILSGVGKRLKSLKKEASLQTGKLIEQGLNEELAKLGKRPGMTGPTKITGQRDIAKITNAQITALKSGTKEQRALGKQLGNLRGMVSNIKRGDATGAAEAMAYAGPGAGLTALNDIAKRFGGGSIEKLTGLNAMNFRKLTGIGMDQFRQLQGLQTQLKGEQELFVNTIKADHLLTGEQTEMLDNLAKSTGMTANQLYKEIRSGNTKMLDEQTWMSAMTEKQKEQMKKADGLMKTVADQHLGETRKISKLMETVVTKILMEIASFIKGIWDAINNFFVRFKGKEVLKTLQVTQDTVATRLEGLRDEYASATDEKDKERLAEQIKGVQKEMSELTKIQALVSSGRISSEKQFLAALAKWRDQRGSGMSEEAATTMKKLLAQDLAPVGKWAGGGGVRALEQQGDAPTSLSGAMLGRSTALEGRSYSPNEAVLETPYGLELLGHLGGLGLASSMGAGALLDVAPGTADVRERQRFAQAQAAGAATGYKKEKILTSVLGGAEELPGVKAERRVKGAGTYAPRTEKSGDLLLRAVSSFRAAQSLGPGGIQKGEEATKKAFAPMFNTLDSIKDPVERLKFLETMSPVLQGLLDSSEKGVDIYGALEKKGFKFERRTRKELAEQVGAEVEKAIATQRARTLMAELGVSTKEQLETFVPVGKEQIQKASELKGLEEKFKVFDAYFPFGGQAVLAPGDYVINRSAFGRPQTGGKGSMLETAVARESGAGAHARGGGGTGGNVTIVNNINGGDTSRIQRLIVEQIRYIERRRASGQPV